MRTSVAPKKFEVDTRPLLNKNSDIGNPALY